MNKPFKYISVKKIKISCPECVDKDDGVKQVRAYEYTTDY